VDLGYTICFFTTAQFLVVENNIYTFNGNCKSITGLYLSTTLPVIPYWFRFMQCLNKYYYTGNKFPHLVNAGKYFSSILVVISILVHSLVDPSLDVYAFTPLNIIAIIIHIINTLYCWAWDVYMDWGLWRSRKKPFLRKKLLCEPICTYYVIIVGDLVLRFFWVIAIFYYQLLTLTFWNPITSMTEIFRRSIWAFFRVELEALENYEEYRTINISAPKISKVNETDLSLGTFTSTKSTPRLNTKPPKLNKRRSHDNLLNTSIFNGTIEFLG